MSATTTTVPPVTTERSHVLRMVAGGTGLAAFYEGVQDGLGS
jgi:hypothetical protein